MASAAEPVESGQIYTITNVDGREPESLDDFTGDVHLTSVRNGQHLHVTGAVTPNRRVGAVLPEGPCTPGPGHPGLGHHRTRKAGTS